MRVDLREFDELYRQADDPWGFATSPYEQLRYETTMTALGQTHYARVFEPACSIGVLTGLLAAVADDVVACDCSASAIAQAEDRIGSLSNVELVNAAVPEWWPSGTFDLILLSELGYYWDRVEWGRLIERCRGSLRAGGEILAVHWLGTSDDHITNGFDVHHELRRHLGIPEVHVEQLDASAPGPNGFLLERWTTTDSS